MIDIVTERSANLLGHLAALLKLNLLEPALSADLYAATIRQTAAQGHTTLDWWPETLALSHELPTLPLWISTDLALPLDLEQSYAAACQSLRLKV